MDEYHPAHWWDTNNGQLILSSQRQYIRLIKMAVEQSETKNQLNDFLHFIEKSHSWPAFSKKFWKSDFGSLIISEFYAMINKYVGYLNSLE